MAFGVTGFAALRLEPQPQVFQALSIGAKNPVPPSPPYGTPNQNLVPVSQPVAPAVPANLSVAATPAFQAILKINPAPNTTSAVGANNPAVQPQTQPQTPGQPPGPVSFALTAAPSYVTSGEQIVKQTPQALVPQLDHELQKAIASNTPEPQTQPTSTPSLPPSSSPQYVLPANGSALAKIVATVNQLAVSAVYPAPIFSFAA